MFLQTKHMTLVGTLFHQFIFEKIKETAKQHSLEAPQQTVTHNSPSKDHHCFAK